MKLDLREISDFPANVEMSIDAEELALEHDDLVVSGCAEVTLTIIHCEHIYYFQGMVKCDSTMTCSRCLGSYPVLLHGKIDFSIQEGDSSKLNPDEIPENETIVPFGTMVIEINEPIREAILLEVPLKPLCDETCKGICSICGGNKNKSMCDCKIETTDSRWDGLRALTENQSDAESK
ncbi:MAG: DUF177 domain-containing protein [candidate division Zixibacteria bacterium]|nr:DUF177 domain-containing protein [candidate division Zixibacteria bacterium]